MSLSRSELHSENLFQTKREGGWRYSSVGRRSGRLCLSEGRLFRSFPCPPCGGRGARTAAHHQQQRCVHLRALTGNLQAPGLSEPLALNTPPPQEGAVTNSTHSHLARGPSALALYLPTLRAVHGSLHDKLPR